ncbi:MAG: thioredoxin domain-containing protein [Magnetococcales bacterium]|nr:thioredoxin domain-containing protein [Magnetococcales bacterium]
MPSLLPIVCTMPLNNRSLRITLGTLFSLLCLLWNLGSARAENHLLAATSPYLLQHANDPVDWYPWGEEALSRAKRETKLILLSIGYSACHACRLMGQESFRDPATAALLNAHYVSILVDREERPDLDGYFSHILTAMTGSGGWPLNMVLTPTLEPVYGGSYFPLTAIEDRPSFKAVLTTVQSEWQQDREQLLKRLGKLALWLKEQRETAPATVAEAEADPRLTAVTFWQSRFDAQYGGIGGLESKSPQPLLLSLLLRHAALHRPSPVADLALLTLDQMGAGGIRDQLGGAFHRSSVDRRWQVPRFEIMLDDNALLARAYLEGFQLTGRPHYALVVREILADLLDRFRLPGGCFATSLARGDESGSYYTWSEEEITAVLGARQAAPLLELFFDPVEGVVAGRSVLRLLGGLESLPQSRRELADSRQALLAARQRRPAPLLDDKQLTSWNSLMISTLARAAAVLQEPGYLTAAHDCLADLNRLFPSPESLRHSRRGERLGETVFLDDYAFLAQALLDLYEADFDIQHLEQARHLVRAMLDRFQSAAAASLQLVPREGVSAIPARTVLEDGSMPAGHSVALITIQRLALFAQEEGLERAAVELRKNLAGYLAKKAANVPELLHLWDYLPASAVEVIVAGEAAHPDTRLFLQEIRRRLMPGLVLALVEPGASIDTRAWPLLAGRVPLDDKPTVYVCRNLVCRLPVNRLEDLVRVLDGKQQGSD